MQQSALDEAREADLLAGEKAEHVSFRATPALVAAAKRAAGVDSMSEVGVLALAMLAQSVQPDPAWEFMKNNRGVLGEDHTLDV